jgi:hypothetical protein
MCAMRDFSKAHTERAPDQREFSRGLLSHRKLGVVDSGDEKKWNYGDAIVKCTPVGINKVGIKGGQSAC